MSLPPDLEAAKAAAQVINSVTWDDTRFVGVGFRRPEERWTVYVMLSEECPDDLCQALRDQVAPVPVIFNVVGKIEVQ